MGSSQARSAQYGGGTRVVQVPGRPAGGGELGTKPGGERECFHTLPKGGGRYTACVQTPSRSDALFVVDPLPSLNPRADSSYVMMLEAQRRGRGVWVTMVDDLHAEEDRAWAHVMPVHIAAEGQPVLPAGPTLRRALDDFAVVVMRKDPPFDTNYLTATWILDHAKARTLVINDPQGLRDLNEKLAILAYPELTPRTRVARRLVDLHRALEDFGGRMVVKPVFGFGGRGVLVARKGDPNLNAIFELATDEESRWTIAQAFIDEVELGDKRILLVDGEPIGAVLRIPAKGESRSNFHAGGTAAATELDAADRRICAAVGPALRERGQFFAGIDVIGGRLTEINVTSPTGMQETNRLSGLTGDATMQARFWDALDRKIAERGNG